MKRSPRLSSTGKDAVYSVVVGHYCFHYPCIRAFPDCLPYSLYINVSKKEDLRGDTPNYRDYRRYRPMGFPGFLIRLSPSSWSCGFEICDDCLQVHLSPVRSSCHFNRWLGCLKNKNRKRSVYRTEVAWCHAEYLLFLHIFMFYKFKNVSRR